MLELMPTMSFYAFCFFFSFSCFGLFSLILLFSSVRLKVIFSVSIGLVGTLEITICPPNLSKSKDNEYLYFPPHNTSISEHFNFILFLLGLHAIVVVSFNSICFPLTL